MMLQMIILTGYRRSIRRIMSRVTLAAVFMQLLSKHTAD